MASPSQCAYIAHSFGINSPELVLNGTKYENYEFLRNNELSYIEDLNPADSKMTAKGLVFGNEGLTIAFSYSSGTISSSSPLFKFSNNLVNAQCVGSNL